MPAKRKPMRKIKEVLRLKFEAGLSHERIAAATGLSKGAVTKYVQRAAQAGLGWPLPPELDDARARGVAVPARPAAGDQLRRTRLRADLTRSSSARASRCSCCGRSTAPPTRRGRLPLQPVLLALRTLSREPEALHAPGAPRRRQAVHRLQRRHACRSSMRPAARSAAPSSSSPCWARRTTPTPRRPGPSSCPTGSARTSARSNSWARFPLCSSRTT